MGLRWKKLINNKTRLTISDCESKNKDKHIYGCKNDVSNGSGNRGCSSKCKGTQRMVGIVK